MIKRPSDLIPAPLIAELKRLANLPSPWASIEPLERPHFRCHYHADTWLRKTIANNGADIATMISFSAWLKEGPKIVQVTEEQYQALAQVEVRLELKDFSMPYPTMLVTMPEGKFHRGCIVHHYSSEILIFSSISHGYKNDITTLVRQTDGVLVDESLERFDSNVAEIKQLTTPVLRVSCNMLLALTNFGHQSELIFPKEVERDQRLSRENSERGRAAANRVRESPRLISFDREVKLYHKEGSHETGEGSGREVSFHWRRGHWRMQTHGPRGSLRKRILVAPCMVRADLLTVPNAETTTVYRA